MIDEVDDVDEYLVSRHKVGLSPTAHVPDDEDPTQPRCNRESLSGKGWRPIPAEEVDEDQLCGLCLERHLHDGAPDSLRDALDEMDVDEFDRRVSS